MYRKISKNSQSPKANVNIEQYSMPATSYFFSNSFLYSVTKEKTRTGMLWWTGDFLSSAGCPWLAILLFL